MQVLHTDPTRRTAGQYARATVLRLRMRTLVRWACWRWRRRCWAGPSACSDVRFLASEVALLVSMFVITRYVLPLVERRDRGATGRGARGRPARQLTARRLAGDPRREPRPRQRRPHPDRPAGGVHDRDQEPPGPDPRGAACTARCSSQAQAQRRAIERVTGVEVEPLIVFSRAWVDRPLARRKGVRVVPARMLRRLSWSKQPARLTREEIERAHELVAQALLEQHRRAPAASAALIASPSRRSDGCTRARRAVVCSEACRSHRSARGPPRRRASADARAWCC